MAASSSTAVVVLPKGEHLPFESLCLAFDALCDVGDRYTRERIVNKLWSNYGLADHPSFPLIRLMLPHLDTTSRPNYKLKQKNLAKLYVEIMGLTAESPQAQTMTNWKRPSSGLQRSEQGNFPEVMHTVIKQRCSPREDLPHRATVGEVNAMLDRLATEPSKREPLGEIYRKCTALEQKWILRVIIKDMQISMKEDKLFKMLHPDAQELYNSVCDLRATCEKCADPEYRLESISLELFKPLRPRLAGRAEWRQVDKEMRKKGAYVAEYKLDGERLLMHYARDGTGGGGDGGGGSGAQTQWWTRNCKNATGWYGEAMAEIVRRCVPAGVESVMLDGEMMVWDRDTGDFSAFGENRSMAAGWRKVVEGNKQACYVVFDVLWLNGRNLTQRTLRERRDALQGLLKWEEHSLELAAQHEVTGGTNEVMRWLDNAMLHGYEGVMLKSLASAYTPGSRDNDWQKLKPDYVNEMGEQLDLIILAGYYGDGKKRGRSGQISHFLMGLKAPDEERQRWPDARHPLYYPFCKVGTGYSHQKLAQMREVLERGQEKWHKHCRPAHLCGWVPNKTDDEPDVWFKPASSILLQCKAYEITETEAFRPCGLTLRFPRCMAVRLDKDWDQADTHNHVLQIFRDAKGRLASHKRRAEDVAKTDTGGDDGTRGRGGRKAGAAKAPRVVTSVPAHLGLAPGLADVGVADDLDGCAFGAGVDAAGEHPQVVAAMHAPPQLGSTSSEVQRCIKELGGDVRGGVGAEVTHVVVCGKGTVQTTNMLGKAPPGGYGCDLVHHEWVLDCHRARRRLPLEPRYLLLATQQTRERMELEMDRWGDRYRLAADAASLQHATRQVQDERAAAAAAAAAAPAWPSVDERLLELDETTRRALRTPLGSLRDVVAYSARASVRLRLRLLGATVVDAPAARVTHAVLPPSSLTDGTVERVQGAMRDAMVDDAANRFFQKKLVDERWVGECERQERWVEEQPFVLKRPHAM